MSASNEAKSNALHSYAVLVANMVKAGVEVQMLDPYEGGYRKVDSVRADGDRSKGITKDSWLITFETEGFEYTLNSNDDVKTPETFNNGEYEFNFGFIMTELFRFDGHI